MNPRKSAFRVIRKVLIEGAYSNLATAEELSKGEMSEKDKNLFVEIVYGTIERLLTVNYVIGQFSKIKIRKMDDNTRVILQMSAYQLLFLDRVPDYAVINEAVKLAKVVSKRSEKFINGVLRTIAREKGEIEWPDRSAGTVKYLSIHYSYPDWLVKTLLEEYSPDFLEELFANHMEKPKLYLRVNSLKGNRDVMIEELKNLGIEGLPVEGFEEAIELRGAFDLAEIPGIKEGKAMIQDLSSMLVAYVLDPIPGQYVMDLCAAPGGKTLHMGEKMKNQGRIIARDVFSHKVELIKKRQELHGLDIIHGEIHNGLLFDPKSEEIADHVLVDAPCSGVGVIGRKPEIKYRLEKKHLEELPKTQIRILNNGGSYVKKGGFLIYSTCTILKEENQALTERFLNENPDFQSVDLRKREDLAGIVPSDGFTEKGEILLLPPRHGMDGFYIRCFKKNG